VQISCTHRGNQKNIFNKGEIPKKFFAEGKAKIAYFDGGKTYLP
jgi:hypothetical protein